MQIDELDNIMQAITELDTAKMEIQDQMLYMAATLKFAETLKPLTIKYADKLPKSTKFLFKM